MLRPRYGKSLLYLCLVVEIEMIEERIRCDSVSIDLLTQVVKLETVAAVVSVSSRDHESIVFVPTAFLQLVHEQRLVFIKVFDEVYVNKFKYDRRGRLRHIEAYQNTESDSTGKVKALEAFCLKHRMTPDEVVFIGEGTNDCDVAAIAGLAFSFPAATAARDYKNLPFTIPITDTNMAVIVSKRLTSQ